MSISILTNPENAAGKVGNLSHKSELALHQPRHTLVEVQRRYADSLAHQAIEAYIDKREDQMRQNHEAEAAWKHYQNMGLHIDGLEVISWLRSLAAADPLSKPLVKHRWPLPALRT